MPDAAPAVEVELQPVSEFRGRALPILCHLAGYSELIRRHNLQVPLHHELAAVATKNSRRKEDGWIIYPNSMHPGRGTIEHLSFALKYEGVQLLTLKKVFEAFDKSELEQAAKAKPTGIYIRRLCFFYEWLLADELDIADLTVGGYIDAIDTEQQYAAKFSFNDKKFRVRDNLPGTAGFCPLVFKTKKIERYISLGLSTKARKIVESAPRELIARAAAFLLLKDSKASFAIEGENPPKDRIARWGSVISQAGQIELSTDKLVSLQRELIGDARFIHIGLRNEGGFVGKHDSFGQPEPEHISAKSEDLTSLLDGLARFDKYSKSLGFHPVLAAACIAFGFVFIHPFEDGNGRIHRFLMHHVLAELNYTPKEIVFPISSVIYDDIPGYRHALQSTAQPLLALIEWRATDRGNVEVLSDTADFYRFFDATLCVEFLFGCVQQSVEKNLPEELAFLGNRDQFHREVTEIVDMSERTLDLLIRFLRQGHGRLSKRARENEFSALDAEEISEIEEIYHELFVDYLRE